MPKIDEMTIEQAQKLLDTKRQQTLDECMAEIQLILKKHNCTLEAVTNLKSL